MGALHEGHLQLVRAARSHCGSVAASVFLNPLQFAAGEDFEKYPRNLESDRKKLQTAGADFVFAPSADEMYPHGFSTYVNVGTLGAVYEGALRPTHFRGVATVVTKLLHAVAPDVLYLGQKDAQQTAVLRKMVRELDFNVRVEVVPTVREPDGLALSSRNAYLSAQQRAAAPSLYASLQRMLERMRDGSDTAGAREAAQPLLDPIAQWDYLDAVDAQTFEPLQHLRAPAFIIGAARFGSTRLLDNLAVMQ